MKKKKLEKTGKTFIYKTKLDYCGYFISKKKLNYKLTKNILQKFNFFFRIKVMRRLKELRIFYANYRRRTFRKDRVSPKRFFFSNLFSYYNYFKQLDTRSNTLLAFWTKSRIKRAKTFVSTKLYHLNKDNFYSLGKRLPFIKIPNYTSAQILKAKQYAYYFCFKNLTKYQLTVTKLDKQTKNNYGFLGSDFMLISQLFKTNIFPSPRFCYILIKSGNLILNKKVEKNPHKPLMLYDNFRLNPLLLKTLTELFLYKLKTKKLLFNIPNYMDFNYKIFSFFIWRLPMKEEFSIYTYPFIDIHSKNLIKTKKLPKLFSNRLEKLFNN